MEKVKGWKRSGRSLISYDKKLVYCVRSSALHRALACTAEGVLDARCAEGIISRQDGLDE